MRGGSFEESIGASKHDDILAYMGSRCNWPFGRLAENSNDQREILNSKL
jgi:hypothetical protein